MRRRTCRWAQRKPTLVAFPRSDQFLVAVHDVSQHGNFFPCSIDSSSTSSNGVVDLRE